MGLASCVLFNVNQKILIRKKFNLYSTEDIKEITESSPITEQDRVEYTGGSISATLWFEDYNAIFAFEVIFDLLLEEFAFPYAKNSPTRFVKIDRGSLNLGRRGMQAIES